MAKSRHQEICHALIYLAGIMWDAATNQKKREDGQVYCEINPEWLTDVSKRLIAFGEEVEDMEKDV